MLKGIKTMAMIYDTATRTLIESQSGKELPRTEFDRLHRGDGPQPVFDQEAGCWICWDGARYSSRGGLNHWAEEPPAITDPGYWRRKIRFWELCIARANQDFMDLKRRLLQVARIQETSGRGRVTDEELQHLETLKAIIQDCQAGLLRVQKEREAAKTPDEIRVEQSIARSKQEGNAAAQRILDIRP
jgi:hypothetical protein